MVKTVDLNEVSKQFYESLKPSGWANFLKAFLLSNDFQKIIEELYDNAVQGKRFTPPFKDIFKAFRECPYTDLHTIIITSEPYSTINTANGIPFDCSNNDVEPMYTKFLFDAINLTVYPNEEYHRSPNLSRWSNQGVLLLNTALTAQIGVSNAHIKVWKAFTAFLLDSLNSRNCGLVFVFMGEEVKPLTKLINAVTHYKYVVPHPSTALNTGHVWQSHNIFNIVKDIVYKNYNKQIIW